MGRTLRILDWSAIVLLWLVLVTGTFVAFTHLTLTVFVGGGSWQWPRVSLVTVERIERDPNNQFLDTVVVSRGEQERELQMLKEEQRALRARQDIWILDNPHVTALRPTAFRLTPLRLFLEFPLPFMGLSGWGLWILHRRRRKAGEAAQADPGRHRTLYRDEFHLRAQRFAAPADPGKES
ncbi:MAG: hypothetical protein HY823_02730 [Acidobacteria bacterium]|nr:hypothetical protein [Acidobacteriota bacterium]